MVSVACMTAVTGSALLSVHRWFGDFRCCLMSALLRHMRQKHAALY